MTEPYRGSDGASNLAELRAHLTALLFVSDEPIEVVAVARILEVPASTLEAAAASLAEQPPPGLIVQRQGSTLQLATAPLSAEYVRRLRGGVDAQKLSRAALEALAVVAYRQPVTRADIEAIRGVNSDHALETLLARGLVAELGRKEAPGRPMLFGTTLEFLRLLGLRALGDLPSVDDVSS